MLEPILFGSKILFLVLLYLFIFMMVRRLARDLKRGDEPIGMPSHPVQPPAPTPRAAAPAAPLGTPAPAPASSPAPGPAAAPGPRMAPRRNRERIPETAPAPVVDSSTREFDYLVSKLKPRLVVQHSKVVDDGRIFEVKGGATIGRSPRSQIVLPDEFVSSTHARIFARKQFLYLEDLGSTNGTFIDGRRLEGESQIKPGQEIVIGDTIFRFEE